jgi:hypothetical protein
MAELSQQAIGMTSKNQGPRSFDKFFKSSLTATLDGSTTAVNRLPTISPHPSPMAIG